MGRLNPRDKRLLILKEMPPSYHKLPTVEFDYSKSEVIQWALEQDSILDYLMEKLRKSKLIEFNPQANQWIGVDYVSPCGHGYKDWDECPVCRLG